MSDIELSRKYCSAENFGPGPIFSGKIVPGGTIFSETGVIGIRVSPGIVFPRTHIPRDACFPAHISLGMRVSHQ